jgi:hypothetical protein
VAVLWSGLAAKQYRRDVEEVPVQRFFDPALPQEVEERPLVVGPSAALPVGVQDLTRRGEQGFVNVLGAAQLFQEERQVGPAGEPGEPGRVVQPDVEETPDTGISQRSEELRRRLLRETDRIDFRGLASRFGNRIGCPPSTSSSVSTLPSPLM